MGLGGWAGREVWPLSWVRTCPNLRIFGLNLCPYYLANHQNVLEVQGGSEELLMSWSARMLPSLTQRVKVINTFALSKLWYFASVLPLPQGLLHNLEQLVRAFLWLGWM